MTQEKQVVQCPSCHTRLRLATTAETPLRFKVRCSSCKTPFVVRRKDSDRGTQPLALTPSAPLADQKTIATAPTGSLGTGARPPAASSPSPPDPGPTTQDTLQTSRPSGLSPDRRTFETGEMVAGRYKIVRFIDQGGMGEVYEADDSALGQRVALKTIRPTVASDQEALARFKREIHVARQVTHHNVCRIYDLGAHRSDSPLASLYPGGEILFVTMELLQGETLADRLTRQGPIPVAEGVVLARQMAEALDAAHAAGVVHRDFKSANVFLESPSPGRTRAVVTDFGLARTEDGEGLGGSLTIAGSVLGSPAYMAPEQVEGGKVTGAADRYAFGVVLYEMCTGQVPFRGETPLATAVKRLTENPPSPREIAPGLDRHWERTILKCLERHPENRFASGAAIVEALTGADLVREAREKKPPLTLHKVLMVILALVLVLAAVVVNVRVWRGSETAVDTASLLVAPTVARPAIAVMGFHNVTGNQEHAWLADGLAQMLSSELSTGGAVRLIPGENVDRARRELGLETGDGFAPDTLESLRQNLGSDFVVSGAFTLVGEVEAGQLRVDLRLQDTVADENSSAMAVTGTADQIFALVADAGEQLRDALGLRGDADTAGAFRAASQESARLYTSALARLNAQQAADAVDLLEQAVEIDPRNPRVRAALGRALHQLGYEARAIEEGRLAMELSTPLPTAERLGIEGEYRSMVGDWPAAVAIYEQLWRASPDDLELGLEMAEALLQSGNASRAREVAAVLEQLPSAAAGDVRIQLIDARAAGSQGDFRRQAERAAAAADLAGQRGERLRRAQALLLEGWALRNLGEGQHALGVTTEAEGLFQQLSDQPGVGRARLQRGSLLYDTGDLDGARRVFEQGVQTFRGLENQGGLSQALNNLAVVSKRQGELDEAERMYSESLEISTETKNRVGMANALVNLGGIDLRRGALSRGQERFDTALELAREVGDRHQEAYALYYLAVASRRQGELPRAFDLQEQALDLRRSMGVRLGEAASLIDLGNLAIERANPVQAAEHYEAAVAIAEEVGHQSLLAYAQEGLGRVRYEEDRLTTAQELLTTALVRRQELGEVGTEPENRIALARVAVEEGDFETALQQAQMAAEVANRLEAPDLRALAEGYQARALIFLGRQDEGRAVVARAVQRAERTENLALGLEIRLCAARVHAAADRVGEARVHLQQVLADASLAELELLRLEALLLDSRLLASEGRIRTAEEGLVEVNDSAERLGLLRLLENAREASARLGTN